MAFTPRITTTETVYIFKLSRKLTCYFVLYVGLGEPDEKTFNVCCFEKVIYMPPSLLLTAQVSFQPILKSREGRAYVGIVATLKIDIAPLANP